MRIDVTRSLVPSLSAFMERLRPSWEEARFSNQGPLVRELEDLVGAELGTPHGVAVTNGTLALQLACSGLELRGEVLTSPLSFVATTTALLWIGLEPVFVDIDPACLTLDPRLCREKITERTTAILATHVYGFPCDVEGLEAVAQEHGLKLLYDASHAFGCRYRGRPLAAFGDASALSFHATKIFHTGEGGFVATPHAGLAHALRVQRDFGFDGMRSFQRPGINAKLSELHAALGLCVLPLVPAAIRARRERFELYLECLDGLGERIRLPQPPEGLEYNYAFFPVVLESEEAVLEVWRRLVEIEVFARRYFHPSLSELPYTRGGETPIAEEICPRLLCLPLYDTLELTDVERIADTVRRSLG